MGRVGIGEPTMRTKILILTIILSLTIASCYAGMSGTVVDAETEMPIEGAVVLVNWTITKGVPGLSYGEDYKTVEAVTDKEGKFKVSGVLNPFVNPPTIVVYKKGYVAWNNEYIFPSWAKRTDFEYKDNAFIKLEYFKKEFTHQDHVAFISSAAISSNGGKVFEDAYLWERILSRKEMETHKKIGIEGDGK